MNALFVDTAGWLMLADRSDPLHEAASGVRDDFLEGGGVVVTTDFIMDETLTLLRMKLGLGAAEKWWSQVDSSARVRWERIDPQRVEKSLVWFFGWRDKAFSFTDCTSFVVMKELKLKKALTCDRYFVMAGFDILP